MATHAWTSICQNFVHYKRCYDVFEKRSGKIDLYNNWAKEEFSRVAEDICGRRRNPGIRNPICTLGIGSGKGSFEMALLKQLQPNFPSIHHTVVEPCEEFISHYKLHSVLENVQYDWQLKTFQQYMQDQECTSNGRKFDFISAVNSLYYTGNVKETIRSLIDQLTESGYLLVVVRSEKGAGFRIIVNFPELHPAFKPSYFISSKTVSKAIAEMGLTAKVNSVRTNVDFSCVFDDNDAEGDDLLDLFTGVMDFRRTAPESLVERVLKFLRQESTPDSESASATDVVNTSATRTNTSATPTTSNV
ncbi:histamine N-methyltransferase A-like [Lytechinus pictus]|uniref:histamine N-methyltransferase A-like n=1 Tax=Lytechinus pictus TaxID=7653 RepID=UPI0030B9FF2C